MTQDDFLWRGGFPELWDRPEMDRALWLGSYLSTYLERMCEICRTSEICVIRSVPARRSSAGGICSRWRNWRGMLGWPNTAKNWLSILQASQQLFCSSRIMLTGKTAHQSSENLFQRHRLADVLLGFKSLADLMKSALWGAVWENFVLTEVRKLFQNLGQHPWLWFWRTSNGAEIDLLVEESADRFWGIECKTASEVPLSALKGIHSFRRIYGPMSLPRGRIACRTGQSFPLVAGGSDAAVPLRGPEGLLRQLDS